MYLDEDSKIIFPVADAAITSFPLVFSDSFYTRKVQFYSFEVKAKK
jgi:hypothetical protein